MNNQDELLQLAIADGKAIIMLSLVDRADIFNEIVSGIITNTQLELTSARKSLESELDGKKVIFKGSMKEYHAIEEGASFIMPDQERFSIKFGQYQYSGLFRKGVIQKFQDEVKEVIFDVTNTITKGKLPTHLGMNKITITGIKKIILVV